MVSSLASGQGDGLLHIQQQPVTDLVGGQADAADVQPVEVGEPQDCRGDLPVEPGGNKHDAYAAADDTYLEWLRLTLRCRRLYRCVTISHD